MWVFDGVLRFLPVRFLLAKRQIFTDSSVPLESDADEMHPRILVLPKMRLQVSTSFS